MTQLTILNLRFTAQVETTIQLAEFKGSALRGAWQSHLRTLYCSAGATADPLHQQLCPVCYLLSRETGSGADRRPYVFRPPLSDQTRFEAGEPFVFEVSLFGQARNLLPYLVLAVNEMGLNQGLGQPIHAGRQRGRFRLVQLEAVDPFRPAVEVLMKGDLSVSWPTLIITEESVMAQAEQLLAQANKDLAVTFLTPMRLIVDRKLLRRPEFGTFFQRLLERWSALRQQFADETPLDSLTWNRLISLAQAVQLVKNDCRWQEVRGHSTRLDRAQELGGLVGQAIYHPPESGSWRELLPYLLWGQVMQVGKNVVKGGGVYQLGIGN